jgi:hypothetical protein
MPQPKKVTYFKTQIDDRPGTLHMITQELQAKKIGLVALWGYAKEPGKADLYCIPKDADKFRAFMKGTGMAAWEGTGFLLKGTDKTGALVRSLEGLAKAGVNMTALHAMAALGNFGAFLHVSDADVEKTAAILKAK